MLRQRSGDMLTSQALNWVGKAAVSRAAEDRGRKSNKLLHSRILRNPPLNNGGGFPMIRNCSQADNSTNTPGEQKKKKKENCQFLRWETVHYRMKEIRLNILIILFIGDTKPIVFGYDKRSESENKNNTQVDETPDRVLRFKSFNVFTEVFPDNSSNIRQISHTWTTITKVQNYLQRKLGKSCTDIDSFSKYLADLKFHERI